MAKTIIYQILVRLFGNKKTNPVFDGTLEQNGVGKFNDISIKALEEIKLLGISHVWYTGIIAHATTTSYTKNELTADDSQLVKGKAGSPYAIKDYYDVDADLAVNVDQRMREFEQLIERTHQVGLKTIIDFVPNHVARSYRSKCKPKGTIDLGEQDQSEYQFSTNNNFYYLPHQHLHLPTSGNYHEFPAKATGNDVFDAQPKINDWWETVKLNYGIDYSNNSKHFDPIPDTWIKMVEIVCFWAAKGIDGFRCDMCEMVPVEFWAYLKNKLNQSFPEILLIGEAYSPQNYQAYINAGFDLLYDKVGLYDTLRAIACKRNTFEQMSDYRYSEVEKISHHMLAFLENHDEQRIASSDFLGNPHHAFPIMALSACLDKGAILIYNGQELGAKATGKTGFSGDDGRTSLFDYTNIPEQQAWMNEGTFDGKQLNTDQQKTRQFYSQLLTIVQNESALLEGNNYHLNWYNKHSEGFNAYLNYAFVRFTQTDCIIIVLTVDETDMQAKVKFPNELIQQLSISEGNHYKLTDLLDPEYTQTINLDHFKSGISIHIPSWGVRILKLKKRE